MSTLRQHCPSCGRQLELPANAMGRLAKCPACESTFHVVDPATANPATSAADVGQAAEAGQLNETTDRERRVSMNPLGPASSAGPSYQSAPPASWSDPYAPSYSPSAVVTMGNIQIVERSIEDVVSPAWSIFVERWPPLLFSLLIVGGAGIVAIAAPVIVMTILASNQGDTLAIFGMLLLVPIMIVASTYAWVGLARVSLAVAKNCPTPLSELLAPMNLVWRMLFASILVSLVIGSGVLLVGGLLGGIAFAAGGEQAAIVIQALVVLVSLFGSFVVQVVLWPMPFLISDGKATTIEAIPVAYAIAMQNKLTSFLLILITMVLWTVGSSLCYVGLLATQPLTLLLLAVAYLAMTNQGIANPKAFQAEPTNPDLPRSL